MAERPWVTPEDVKEYTEYAAVQNRTDARLRVDISRAEQYVISYTNNHFTDYETIPEPVRTAVILLAEGYAYGAAADTKTGGKRLKSESFDDYSYTAADSETDWDTLLNDVKILLDPYIIVEPRNGVTFRMRRL